MRSENGTSFGSTLGCSLGTLLGLWHRARKQQGAETEAWGGVWEELKTLPRGLGKGLWKELFVLLRSELGIYTP